MADIDWQQEISSSNNFPDWDTIVNNARNDTKSDTKTNEDVAWNSKPVKKTIPESNEDVAWNSKPVKKTIPESNEDVAWNSKPVKKTIPESNDNIEWNSDPVVNIAKSNNDIDWNCDPVTSIAKSNNDIDWNSDPVETTTETNKDDAWNSNPVKTITKTNDDDAWNGSPVETITENKYDKEPSSAEFSLMRKVLRSKLLHTSNKVEILQKDPNNPLYSAKSFEELNMPEELLRGIYDMGFSKPSRIQETALPILLDTTKTNLIGQSQSGTGKTAAFILASLYRINPAINEPQVIILSPTYELALQTGAVAKQMAKYKPDITIKYVIRGEVMERGTRITEHILIGTPGKMIDWSLKYHFFDIKKISVFVLDEADVMIDTQGLRAQSIQLKRFLPDECQMMLFSATYTEEVMEFARTIICDPVVILKLRQQEQSLDNINQLYIEVNNQEDKYIALTNIFGTISIGQAFIFCETRVGASRLVQQLRQDEHSVGFISGDLTVEQRNEAILRFREAKERVIVATNVMARGIDVEQVTLVINYDLPINPETRRVDFETYLHRIGRTGRFGKEGLAINFVDGPRTLNMIHDLENHFGKQIKKLDATDFDEIEKEIGNDL